MDYGKPLNRIAMSFNKMIHRAHWLNDSQKGIIAKALIKLQAKGLSYHELVKLAGLLCGIPYAEKVIRLQGKSFLTQIEGLLMCLQLHTWFCRTFGTWNFGACHANRFGYGRKEFKELLQKDDVGVDFVIDFILKYIGLRKPIDHIFAEYNYKEKATSVAALQRALNCLMKKQNYPLFIEEDGWIGKETLAALKHSNQFLQDDIDERDIEMLLDRFAIEEGIRVQPFVPQVRIRRDFGFFRNILCKSLRQPSLLLKLPHIFYNHINVPLYVDAGMDAYHYLLSDI